MGTDEKWELSASLTNLPDDRVLDWFILCALTQPGAGVLPLPTRPGCASLCPIK